LACTDSVLRVWDVKSGQEINTLHGHNSEVYGVAFLRDGTRLASTGMDQTVKAWDPATGQTTLTLLAHSAAGRTVVFSPDGTRLASAGQDGVVRV
jgi:WD40 repeat protein